MKATPAHLSNNQIDKLGERLKLGLPTDDDVEMLSAYRNGFAEAANIVANVVRQLSRLEVTVRPLKSTLSIVAKLRRDGVKQLSSMQDVGGCRVTVSDLAEQDNLIEKLIVAFPNAKLYDRVANPSHGYRAKHLVVRVEGRRIEIQVRTAWQHQWAMLSEAISDVAEQNLKYGIGDSKMLQMLLQLSDCCLHLDHTALRIKFLPMNVIEKQVKTQVHDYQALVRNFMQDSEAKITRFTQQHDESKANR